MNQILLAFLTGIGLSLITVLGDVFVKQASLQPKFTGWKLLMLGALIYGLTAIGWFFVLRKIKLSTSGGLYSLSIIIFLTLASVFYFKEKITGLEILAIILAIISLILLYRFA